MVIFFFKQRTAYEVLRSLVGSEMYIRGRVGVDSALRCSGVGVDSALRCSGVGVDSALRCGCFLIYTSDAADALRCVYVVCRCFITIKNL